MKNTHGNDWTSGSDSNQTDNYLVNDDLVVWSPTMHLRWKMTEIKLDFYGSHCKPELQQLWISGLDKEEWRPIELV